MRHGNAFAHICLSVCLFVCPVHASSFESLALDLETSEYLGQVLILRSSGEDGRCMKIHGWSSFDSKRILLLFMSISLLLAELIYLRSP